MAIDSQDKRRSAQGYGLFAYVYPVADGAVGTSDRPHVAGLYRGLSYSAPTVSATPAVIRRQLVAFLRSLFNRRLG